MRFLSCRAAASFNKWVDPAVARYKEAYRDHDKGGEVYSDEGEAFKSNLRSFVRLYGFLSQVIEFVDPDLHKLYAYGGLLLTKLPYRSNAGAVNLDDEVALESYRLEKTFEGSGALGEGDTGYVMGPGGEGTGGFDPESSPLSKIIDIVNDRYGTDFTEADSLLIKQVGEDLLENNELTEQLRANTIEQVKPVYEEAATHAFVNRHDRNEKVVDYILRDEELRELIISEMLREAHSRARAGIGA